MEKAMAKGTIEMSAENKNWYDRKGYHMTGETLTLGDENSNCTYVVFKGSWTRYDTVRDCGDQYIKAQHSRYDRIDKETLEITRDVEDR